MIEKNNINIDNYILYNNIPTIDLHGETKEVAVLKVKEFIEDNIKLKNFLIAIVHGIGEGVLKEEIHKYLKTDNLMLYLIRIKGDLNARKNSRDC